MVSPELPISLRVAYGNIGPGTYMPRGERTNLKGAGADMSRGKGGKGVGASRADSDEEEVIHGNPSPFDPERIRCQDQGRVGLSETWVDSNFQPLR